MGTLLGSATGLSGNVHAGGAGSGYVANNAPLQTPTTEGQANEQYVNANNAIQQQQAFTQAVNAQNGLANQSAVYSQLQGVANGTGPNPAQAQLAQATGANVSNQAALMAGQRGSSANAGLIARQAAQQGAATQQNAAGQAATLQANQSLNAINSAGQLATNQANQAANAANAYTTAAQGEQSQILGAIQGQNQAQVGNVAAQNQANASVANSVTAGQQGLLGGISAGVGSLGNLFADGGMVDEVPGASAIPALSMLAAGGSVGSTPLQQVSPDKPQSFAGKYLSGMGGQQGGGAPLSGPAALSSGSNAAAGLAVKGGEWLYNKAFGPGPAEAPSQWAAPADGYQNALSGSMNPDAYESAGKLAGGIGDTSSGAAARGALQGVTTPGAEGAAADALSTSGGAATTETAAAEGVAAEGGTDALLSDLVVAAAQGGRTKAPVKALLSPGEKYLAPKDVQRVEKGANPMAVGKKVPGKPVVGGAKNSYANDIVPATLEKGGIVLPRSVTQAKDPAKAAAAFVRQVMAQKGKSMPVSPAKKR